MRTGILDLCVAALATMLAAGCGAGPSVAPVAPQEAPAALDGASAVAVAEDSAADLAALDALHDLEFRSLSKGAGHVRGVLPARQLGALELAVEDGATAAGPRGGAASAASPTYDIDVDSFADRDRVRYYTDYFRTTARDRFEIWLGRLPRYEGMIRDRFRAAGVPEDLVYLALIESGYSNSAVSRSNAVGMWQFIASTARNYGLEVTTWVDERRDPFAATDAAARHLSDLYSEFGSWYLAAAAYNGGAGRISRGVRRLFGTADSLSDDMFFDLAARRYLRLETRDYVPKLIAAAILAKDPRRYGLRGGPVLSPLVFDEITVPDQTGLDVIAGLADTTARALMELNPKYVRGVTPPGREAIVRVPRGEGTLVARRYAELPTRERVNFLQHTVRSGETLSEIGERYRVSVTLLRAANHHIDPRRLRIGMHLVIPVSAAARTQTAAGRAPRPAPTSVPGVRYHVVRSGETLWLLSQRYGVTIANLRLWNGLGVRDVLRVGTRLSLTPPTSGTR